MSCTVLHLSENIVLWINIHLGLLYHKQRKRCRGDYSKKNPIYHLAKWPTARPKANWGIWHSSAWSYRCYISKPTVFQLCTRAFWLQIYSIIFRSSFLFSLSAALKTDWCGVKCSKTKYFDRTKCSGCDAASCCVACPAGSECTGNCTAPSLCPVGKFSQGSVCTS